MSFSLQLDQIVLQSDRGSGLTVPCLSLQKSFNTVAPAIPLLSPHPSLLSLQRGEPFRVSSCVLFVLRLPC